MIRYKTSEETRKRTFLDPLEGVGHAVHPAAHPLQLGQPFLQPVAGPPAVSHLHHQCALEATHVPVHPFQAVTAVLDVLVHLQLDLVQLRDDLVFCVSCRV